MSCRNIRTFLFMFLFYQTGALKCYQCGDSTATGDCVTDTATMQAQHMEYNKTSDDQPGDPLSNLNYLKQCKNGTDACIIEKIEEQGLVYAYLRDCFDTTNNFTLNLHNQRLLTLKDNVERNHTACVYHAWSKRVLCVSLCNTDFCNGPAIDAGVTNHPFLASLVLTFVLPMLVV